MAPGAAGDDKSKEEEKKVSKQEVSKLDKIDNFAGQEVASQQFRQQWRRKEGEGEEQVQGEGIFPLGVAVTVRSLVQYSYRHGRHDGGHTTS